MWTGQADYFPLNSCQNPIVLDKLMWALCAASHIRLLFLARHGLYRQWNLHLRSKADAAKYGKSNRGDSAKIMFVAITLMMVFVLPVLIAIFIVRAVTDLHFGVDLSITLPLAVMYPLYMVTLAAVEHEMFKIMVLGAAAMGERGKAEELIRKDRATKRLGTLAYSAVYFAMPVAQVFLPVGPNAARIALTAVSNIATVLYFAHYYVAYTIMYNKLNVLLGSSDLAAYAQKPNGGLSSLLTQLSENVQHTKRLTLLLFMLTVIFTLTPQLYAFTYVKNTFLLFLSAGKSHVLLGMSISTDKTSSADNGLVAQQERNSKVIISKLDITFPTNDNHKQTQQQEQSVGT